MTAIQNLTEKELRRLGRRDLLALMLDQAKTLDTLEHQYQDEQSRHARELEALRQSHEEATRRLKASYEERIGQLTRLAAQGEEQPQAPESGETPEAADVLPDAACGRPIQITITQNFYCGKGKAFRKKGAREDGK